jgi:hypothetical protein
LNDEKQFITVDMAINNLPELQKNGGENFIRTDLKPQNTYQEFLAEKISIEDYHKIISPQARQ